MVYHFHVYFSVHRGFSVTVEFMRTNSTGSLVESSVKVEDFSQHVHNMHMHSDIAFSEEYEVMLTVTGHLQGT